MQKSNIKQGKSHIAENSVHNAVYDTPIGQIIISSDLENIIGINFVERYPVQTKLNPSPLTDKAAKQLKEYFLGKRETFDLPLKPKGTEFQLKVWEFLQTIAYGETRSYKQVAEGIGNPKACRAVGMANNKNPISIIIPCHRVVGANGNLVGYGGGIEAKKQLLNLEQTQE